MSIQWSCSISSPETLTSHVSQPTETPPESAVNVDTHSLANDNESPLQTAAGIGDLASQQVMIDGKDLTLSEFLRWCADSLDRQDASSETAEFLYLRDRFLKVGLAELGAANSEFGWIQLGLEIENASEFTAVYPRIADTARELLESSVAHDFFYMHKPPGLRLRFEVAGPELSYVTESLHERLASWVKEGIVKRVVPAVYEPESHLFGGAISMHSVHRLFTLDSLAWLDYHVLTSSSDEATDSAWVLSLYMLQAVFSGLGITGWEYIDVWNRVRVKTGRNLPDKQVLHSEFEAVAEGIRAGWLEPDMLLEQLSSASQEIARRYQQSITPETVRWCQDYFWTQEAYIGPREAAAFFIIFHWNRARLPMLRQALITEALASREAV